MCVSPWGTRYHLIVITSNKPKFIYITRNMIVDATMIATLSKRNTKHFLPQPNLVIIQNSKYRRVAGCCRSTHDMSHRHCCDPPAVMSGYTK